MRATSIGKAVGRECLPQGLVDELQIGIAPMLLGGGVRLFRQLPGKIRLKQLPVIESPGRADPGIRVVQ